METKGWNLPRGITKEDIKAREKVIKDFYVHWISGNPEKKVWNDNLQDYILVKFISINETFKKLLIMRYDDVKLIVGVQKSNQDKVQYSLSAIAPSTER